MLWSEFLVRGIRVRKNPHRSGKSTLEQKPTLQFLSGPITCHHRHYPPFNVFPALFNAETNESEQQPWKQQPASEETSHKKNMLVVASAVQELLW
jgi:hypothetical protein